MKVKVSLSIRNISLIRLLFVIACLIFSSNEALAKDKYRVIIMTDMTHDDGNSLIRYLYYSNEFDTEAIIVTPQLPDYNFKDSEPWNKVNLILNAYSSEYEHLKKHQMDYPTPEKMFGVTKKGGGALPIIWLTNTKKFSGKIADRFVESEWGEIKFSDWIGDGNTPNGEPKDSDGSDFLQKVFEKDDDRPIFVQMWGGSITFVQALYRYKQNHSVAEFDKLMNKLHVFGILLQDITFDYLIDLDKVQSLNCTNMGTVKSTYDGKRITPKWLLHDSGHFWHYVYGRDSAYVKPMYAHEVNGHGPMSDIYDNGGEGDTPSFLYLLSANRGLNDPLEPTQGSWGSLFAPMGSDFPEGYYHTCDVNKTHLTRWVKDAKLSFENRLDYSIKEPAEVNREPNAIIADIKENVSIFPVTPGSSIQLDASASYDPDNDNLSFRWYFYPDEKDLPTIENENASIATIQIPQKIKESVFHLILEVVDDGVPALKAYRRIILK